MMTIKVNACNLCCGMVERPSTPCSNQRYFHSEKNDMKVKNILTYET